MQAQKNASSGDARLRIELFLSLETISRLYALTLPQGGCDSQRMGWDVFNWGSSPVERETFQRGMVPGCAGTAAKGVTHQVWSAARTQAS